MAAMFDSIPAFVGICSGIPSSCSSLSSSTSSISVIGWPRNGRKGFSRRSTGRKSNAGACRAMVQQTFQGTSANYAREMERLSAKESLLLAVSHFSLILVEESAEISIFNIELSLSSLILIKSARLLGLAFKLSFKDSGGLTSLVTGKTTDLHRIDVNERITSLERLNPTPRPTTSPFLEGQWNFEWFGAGSPGLFAARFIFERFPSTFANLLGMEVVIKEGYAKTTANVKLLNSIESKFTLTAQLSVEGPLRMKEEYVEGVLESPAVSEEAVPEQLKGAFGQAVGTLQQLPVPISDAMANGLRFPLSKHFNTF
ncbi:hypothetical protein HHK36_012012 [Tetracentron sinense]|uniref:Plastid lipid-associated protein/fibrillin conserved domain-containing protein n=1 Tax=Tetracentron sinense TaxID=13715 RepID=A0A835DHT3_TETSI|nr:hypothetical protein HHK36_012012 [Tetracentron sinense]